MSTTVDLMTDATGPWICRCSGSCSLRRSALGGRLRVSTSEPMLALTIRVSSETIMFICKRINRQTTLKNNTNSLFYLSSLTFGSCLSMGLPISMIWSVLEEGVLVDLALAPPSDSPRNGSSSPSPSPTSCPGERAVPCARAEPGATG